MQHDIDRLNKALSNDIRRFEDAMARAIKIQGRQMALIAWGKNKEVCRSGEDNRRV